MHRTLTSSRTLPTPQRQNQAPSHIHFSANTTSYHLARNLQLTHRLGSAARAAPSPAPPAVADADAGYDPELQRALLAGPPPEYDFRGEVMAGSREWVARHAPELADLVEEGALVVLPRRPDYAERRADGYREPGVVLLLGTAHVSARSQRDAVRVVRAVRPDSVVVELCSSRSAVLAATPAGLEGLEGLEGQQEAAAAATFPAAAGSGSESDCEQPTASPGAGAAKGGHNDGSSSSSSSSSSSTAGAGPGPGWVNPMSLAGRAGGGGGGGGGPDAGFLPALSRSVALGGQGGLLLRLLLAGLAGRAAGALGVAGGGEFAAARLAAEEVGAQVVLGDRPVEITLSRAWAALPPARRAALCWELGRAAAGAGAAAEALSAEMVERLKSDDAVGAAFKHLADSYPELVSPLVSERDLYLAWSLKRSRAVNGADRVVGVLGRGHLRGVAWALGRDRGGAGLRFSDLVDGSNSRRRRREKAAKAAARFGIELILGTAAYFAWVAWQQS